VAQSVPVFFGSDQSSQKVVARVASTIFNQFPDKLHRNRKRGVRPIANFLSDIWTESISATALHLGANFGCLLR